MIIIIVIVEVAQPVTGRLISEEVIPVTKFIQCFPRQILSKKIFRRISAFPFDAISSFDPLFSQEDVVQQQSPP